MPVYRRRRRVNPARRRYKRRYNAMRRFKRKSYRITRPRFSTQFIRIKKYIQMSGTSGTGFNLTDWNFPSSTTVDTFDNYNFDVRASNMSDFSTYAALYQQYRIRHAKIFIQYMSSTENFQGAPSGGVLTSGGVNLMGWTDPDDVTDYPETGAGWRSALEASCGRVKRFPNVRNNTYRLYLKYPKVLYDVDDSGTGRPLSAKVSPWLSTDDDTVPHFGFKFLANATANTQAQVHIFRFFMKLYIDFKRSK